MPDERLLHPGRAKVAYPKHIRRRLDWLLRKAPSNRSYYSAVLTWQLNRHMSDLAFKVLANAVIRGWKRRW